MYELSLSTKRDGLLSGPGIPFPIDYPALRSSLDVTLHLEGAMTYTVADGQKFASVETDILCAEACSALAIAVSEAAERIGHPSRIQDHAEELTESVRARLAKRWAELYGAEPGALAITNVSVAPEDQALMEKMDRSAEFAGKPAEEQMSAMADMLRSAQMEALNALRPQTESWICTCGAENRGNFCPECGKIRTWVCQCGSLNTGNFCPECGKARAQGETLNRGG